MVKRTHKPRRAAKAGSLVDEFRKRIADSQRIVGGPAVNPYIGTHPVRRPAVQPYISTHPRGRPSRPSGKGKFGDFVRRVFKVGVSKQGKTNLGRFRDHIANNVRPKSEFHSKFANGLPSSVVQSIRGLQ